MNNPDRLSNFHVGDTITINNPRTGNIDAVISIERIAQMSTKKYYTIKISSRLYEYDKYISKAEDTNMSDIINGLTGHYETMDINEEEGAE